MSEPTAPLLASGGLTILGIVTGIHPELLIAGFLGCWWYNTYLPELGLGQRLGSGIVAALVAAWSTPPIILYIVSLSWWPTTVPALIAGFPLAVAIGFLTHKVIGPALLKIAQKKVEALE